MKADTYEKALDKAHKRSEKEGEPMYILQDYHGFYCADELTVCCDLRSRKIIKTVMSGGD